MEFNAYNWKHRTLEPPIPQVEDNPVTFSHHLHASG